GVVRVSRSGPPLAEQCLPLEPGECVPFAVDERARTVGIAGPEQRGNAVGKVPDALVALVCGALGSGAHLGLALQVPLLLARALRTCLGPVPRAPYRCSAADDGGAGQAVQARAHGGGGAPGRQTADDYDNAEVVADDSTDR